MYKHLCHLTTKATTIRPLQFLMLSVVRHLHNHCIVDSQIVCAKVREGDQRIVRIKEGDPRGRHVVIVDDLVQSGGTLIECQV